MYVKIFNQILDSSIADNRKLRHFFIDLLLCSDPDGNVLMTKRAIASRIKTTEDEVEWGLGELMKPDPHSNHADEDGRRIVPLEGHGYGWRIINYAFYRDMKTARQLRDDSAERMRRYRERKKAEDEGKPVPNQEPEKPKRVQFVKPTIPEIEFQCHKMGIDPDEATKFYHHHEARGWIIGKYPMKSWMSALVTWKMNIGKWGTPTSQGTTSKKMSDAELVAQARG